MIESISNLGTTLIIYMAVETDKDMHGIWKVMWMKSIMQDLDMLVFGVDLSSKFIFMLFVSELVGFCIWFLAMYLFFGCFLSVDVVLSHG